MNDYLLGLITLPTFIAVVYVLFRGGLAIVDALEDHGVTFSLRLKRDRNSISDYTLRNDIWFERAFGPVFTGHWYRERQDWSSDGNTPPATRLINRWVGFGRAEGPCFNVFVSRELDSEN